MRTVLALTAAAAVIAAGGVAVGLAARPGLSEAQNPGDGGGGPAAGPSASLAPSAGASAAPGAVPASNRPGGAGRTPVEGPSRPATNAPTAGAPTRTAVPTGATPAPTGGAAGNPYTPGEVCGNKFTVVDSAPLLAGDGTLQGRVYLLYNASSRRNCTTTLKAADVGTPTATSAYLEPEGADRVADSGQFEYYAGPVKVKAAETCVKWGGAAGGVRFDSPSGRCP
jgi:serine/threonine-protein kinase